VRRLVEESFHPGSPEQWLADLVRATPPLNAAGARLQSPRVLTGAATASRTGLPTFAQALTVLVLLGVTAAALAAGRPLWRTHRSSTPAAARAALLQPAGVLPATAPLPTVDAPTEPPVSASLEREQGAAIKSRGRAHAPKSPESGEDPGLVLAAIHALRDSGDPAGASALLSRYLKLHPHGVLAEDALALSIESAASRHDGRAAAEWGRVYLAEFPNGRFRPMALRASHDNMQ